MTLLYWNEVSSTNRFRKSPKMGKSDYWNFSGGPCSDCNYQSKWRWGKAKTVLTTVLPTLLIFAQKMAIWKSKGLAIRQSWWHWQFPCWKEKASIWQFWRRLEGLIFATVDLLIDGKLLAAWEIVLKPWWTFFSLY